MASSYGGGEPGSESVQQENRPLDWGKARSECTNQFDLEDIFDLSLRPNGIGKVVDEHLGEAQDLNDGTMGSLASGDVSAPGSPEAHIREGDSSGVPPKQNQAGKSFHQSSGATTMVYNTSSMDNAHARGSSASGMGTAQQPLEETAGSSWKCQGNSSAMANHQMPMECNPYAAPSSSHTFEQSYLAVVQGVPPMQPLRLKPLDNERIRPLVQAPEKAISRLMEHAQSLGHVPRERLRVSLQRLGCSFQERAQGNLPSQVAGYQNTREENIVDMVVSTLLFSSYGEWQQPAYAHKPVATTDTYNVGQQPASYLNSWMDSKHNCT